jgi:hypothetical protein
MNLDVASALWTAANTHGHEGIELEFRVGHMLPTGFSSNIGKDNFETLRRRLDASSAFSRIVDVETVEIVGGSMKHVTTVSLADPDPKPPPPPFCMTKTGTFRREFETAQFTVRCSIAVETSVPLRVVSSRLTRRKRRRRYMYKCWAFDLTEVVSTADVDTEETYEVEIELVDTGMLFERTMVAMVDWGLALVDDLVRMLA